MVTFRIIREFNQEQPHFLIKRLQKAGLFLLKSGRKHVLFGLFGLGCTPWSTR
jgi:hypothetical protein